MARKGSIKYKGNHKLGIVKSWPTVKIVLAWIVLSIFSNEPAALASTEQILDRIVANVNGEIILLSDLRKEIASLRDMQRNGAKIDSSMVTESAVLQSIIDESIIAFHAKEREIKVSAIEVDQMIEEIKEENGFSDEELIHALKSQSSSIQQLRKNLKRRRLVKKVMSYEITQTNISENEIRQYYIKNKDKFTKVGRIRAKHIVILLPKESGKTKHAEVKKTIYELLAKIQNGGNFSEIASKYSQDGSASLGGDLGWFKPGDMVPEFEQIAFSLKEGELGGPVKTKFGYHLILVTNREKPELVPLKDVSAKMKKSYPLSSLTITAKNG